jgi:hypothetical protein
MVALHNELCEDLTFNGLLSFEYAGGNLKIDVIEESSLASKTHHENSLLKMIIDNVICVELST